MTNRLAKLRKEKKLTQEQLADEIGKTKRTIIYWEKEHRDIKSGIAQELADFFNVSVGYLLGFDNDRKKDEQNLIDVIDDSLTEFTTKISELTEEELIVTRNKLLSAYDKAGFELGHRLHEVSDEKHSKN